jgi:signal transduction histidine kinase
MGADGRFPPRAPGDRIRRAARLGPEWEDRVMRIATLRRTSSRSFETRHLDANATLRLPGGDGVVVRAEAGTTVVTQEGDHEDHLLQAGDELVLRDRGRAVAWALTGATLSVCEGRPLCLVPPWFGREDPSEDPEELGRDAGAALAHELKNPLSGMKALAQLGLRNPEEHASHARLALIERELGRMREILERYLASRRAAEQVKPARVELGALVADTLQVLSARAADARVRLVARGDATIEADPRRLRDALLNLVVNAIEATPAGGEVAVDVRPRAGQAEIVVRDTGRGMAPETLSRVGTPFFTTREDGTGLGVVLARSVIAGHGGSLRFESVPGKGTTVRATLPLRARAA